MKFGLDRKRIVGIVTVVLFGASLIVASLSYKPTGSTRRGRSVDGLWNGFLVILGVEGSREPAEVLWGRILFVAFLAAAGFWIYLTVKARRERPAAEPSETGEA